MLKPVKHGDTMQVRSTVVEKRDSPKPDRGVVVLRREIVNQRDDVVQELQATIVYRRRPG
jgi:acyl dehydratase